MRQNPQRGKTEDESLVQSVDRALQILLVFETGDAEYSVGQLSAILDLPKSTIHRLLTTLAHHGFIEQIPASRNYRLGLKLHVLGSRLVETRSLESESIPILHRLMEKCGETVSVSVLDGIHTMIVEKIESLHSMRVTSQIGKRSPIHCSGSGKVLLAFQPLSVAERIVAQAPLDRYTANTITDPKDLLSRLPAIKKTGYAVDDEEIMEDQLCISAPVRNSQGGAFAAITASGPAGRIRSKGVDTIAANVVEAADELSKRLGWLSNKTAE